MALVLRNLDTLTRKYMLVEVERDIQIGKLYISSRLSSRGALEYPQLLRDSVIGGDDSSLASELSVPGRLNLSETRNTKKGLISAAVPITAPQTLAEGEFNRFYARGLCLLAMASDITHLEIYRAKEVETPRSISIQLIGSKMLVDKLLEDLRIHQGTDTALGLPPGPNSGLSVMLPAR
ncbi:hypothetical protein ACFPT7_00250 [Acidicapsa dinghuensis]|uniref:Uncharacterized protein n=1 Tax=Acidicapsa dinghuensis TaxID=2218256 RepID=A0ABW1E9P6_9BACT|nr:hypothetical protein [Acidicapsa dinghuensis]